VAIDVGLTLELTEDLFIFALELFVLFLEATSISGGFRIALKWF